jgi:hypothetical protein
VSAAAPVTSRMVSELKLRTAEVRDTYASYDPPHMAAFGAELRDIPASIFCLASAIRHLTVKSQVIYPVHGSVVQTLVEVYKSVGTARAAAEDIPRVFNTVHQHDIMRLEEPRKGHKGEAMWNIALGPQTDGIGIQNRASVLLRICAYIANMYANQYTPEHMMQVYREYCDLSESITNIQTTILQIHNRTRDVEPVEQPVTDTVGNTVNHLAAAASDAATLMPLFRRYHELDLRKHENPRKGVGGEKRWDV